jgi:hypothetical protein
VSKKTAEQAVKEAWETTTKRLKKDGARFGKAHFADYPVSVRDELGYLAAMVVWMQTVGVLSSGDIASAIGDAYALGEIAPLKGKK